jgi:molybdopterin molybdotransferase
MDATTMNTDTPATAAGSCCDDTHPDPAIRLDEALARILAEVDPVEGGESVPLKDALGRILDEDVHSMVDVPSHTNSAMDGYALAGAELSAAGEATLTVVGTAWAGRPLDRAVGPGECARIMTGGALPDGTDTVVMQEQVEREGDVARIGPGQRAGQHVRRAGEDIRTGAEVLNRGTLLRPAHLGLIASVGVGEVRVRRRPRVAFFSTGDELRGIGQTLGKGEIYDSNRYTIHGMLARAGVEPIDLGVVPDDRAAIEAAFRRAAEQGDAIVTSGGVSVGEADFVTETLERIGEVNFWKVAIKPGRPLAFGRVAGTLFFGLPGNPVSVMATFYQIVQPALERLTGNGDVDPVVRVEAVCESELRKKPGRLEVQRGILSRGADGSYSVRTTGRQGSGVLSSMGRANCFIILPLEQGRVMPGERVQVQPFRGLA